MDEPGIEPGVLELGEPSPVVVGLRGLPRLLAVVGLEEDQFVEQDRAGGATAALEEGLDPRPPPGFPDGLEAVADLVDPPSLGVGQVVEIPAAWPARGQSSVGSAFQSLRMSCSFRSTVRDAQPSLAAISSVVNPSIFQRAMARSRVSLRRSSSSWHSSAAS